MYFGQVAYPAGVVLFFNWNLDDADFGTHIYLSLSEELAARNKLFIKIQFSNWHNKEPVEFVFLPGCGCAAAAEFIHIYFCNEPTTIPFTSHPSRVLLGCRKAEHKIIIDSHS